MLSGQSSNMLITGGTFTTVEGNLHVHESERVSERARELLRSQISPGAFHNSAERYDAPKCHPDTRRLILEEIASWVENDTRTRPFLWIYGPAGSGKSSIAQSVAEMLYKTGTLAASFFFGRTVVGRNTDARLVATLAYQLTLSIPAASPHILQAIDRDPAIFTRSLGAQMDVLIVKPLLEVNLQFPRVVIVDGLDECGEPSSQGHILTVLFDALRHSHFKLSFLIASRPEYEIRNFFNQDSATALSHHIILDDKYEPDADIEVFLKARFDDIRKRHPLRTHLPPSWPLTSDIERLVRKSSGQFIYVSTVMKFVESPRHWPTDRLSIVLGLMSPGKNTPFADLDALYSHIFASIDDAERVIDTFTFLLLVGPDIYPDLETVEDFLFFRRGDLQIILNDLHSIVRVPKPNSVPTLGQRSNIIHVFHASLGDYLLDRTRSGNFFIDLGDGYGKMTKYCIKHLESFSLRKSNISQIRLMRIAYKGLLPYCLLARPTDALLDNLYKFHLEEYLTNAASGRFDGVFHSVPPFMRWIQAQDYPSGTNDLYHRYMAHFDHFLMHQISQYGPVPASSHLFAASTLDCFSVYGWTILNILKLEQVQYPSSPRSGYLDAIQFDIQFRDESVLTTAGKERGWMKEYRNMISKFLTDANRSGTYHVNGSSHAKLARLFIDVLINAYMFRVVKQPTEEIEMVDGKLENLRPSRMTDQGIQKCAWVVIHSVLSCVPVEVGLATYLQNKFRILEEYAERAGEDGHGLLAIQSYIEKYQIDAAESRSSKTKATSVHDSTELQIPGSFPMSQNEDEDVHQHSFSREPKPHLGLDVLKRILLKF